MAIIASIEEGSLQHNRDLSDASGIEGQKEGVLENCEE